MFFSVITKNLKFLQVCKKFKSSAALDIENQLSQIYELTWQ